MQQLRASKESVASPSALTIPPLLLFARFLCPDVPIVGEEGCHAPNFVYRLASYCRWSLCGHSLSVSVAKAILENNGGIYDQSQTELVKKALRINNAMRKELGIDIPDELKSPSTLPFCPPAVKF